MKKSLLFILFIIIGNSLSAQKWTFEKGSNAFDGVYRTSSIIGTGGQFPFTNPKFVINYFEGQQSLNMYFVNAGYSGCDNLNIKLKFNNDPTVYEFDANSNSDRDVWFLLTYNSNLSTSKLLEKLKENSSFEARLESDCGKADYRFSLNGSAAAIDFVASEWVKLKEKLIIENELKRKQEEENKLKKEKEEAETKRLELEKKVYQDSLERIKNLKIQEDIKNTVLNAIVKKYSDQRFKIIILKGGGLPAEDVTSNFIIPQFETKENDIAVIDISKKLKTFYKMIYFHGKGEVNLYIDEKFIKSYEN
jgi:hypothetical protein